ncbi:MAG: M20/M25/M40 family metallo-hydrolase [Chloroflexota bacterium]
MPTTARTPQPLVDLAREVLSIPTASYLEHGVRAYLREFAEARRLEYGEDEFGNAYIRYQRGRPRRPLVLGAHIDHPGFVVTTVAGKRLTLEFRGGVAASYGKGERVRIYGSDDLEPRGTATLTKIEAGERGMIASANARLEDGDVEVGDLALWDVTPFRLRGEIVHARACDDLAGAVSVLATLDRVLAARKPGTLIGLFTRAEEVGLRGASVVGRARLLPDDALVVAVETSSMAGGRAEQGAGPVIRIGDAIHVFSPMITRWMVGLAQELASTDATFHYQRKLMDGGTTEATAYDLYGYETGAACMALGNYHNAGPRGRIAAETVHLGDLEGLVRIFVRMLETVPKAETYLDALRKRLDGLGRAAERPLRRSR